MNYQEFLSNKFPFFAKLYRKYRLFRLSKKSTRKVFTDIYLNNTWKSDESYSGAGSSLTNTTNVRRELPILIKNYNIKSFLDLPCGDYHWMKEVNLNVEKYIGGDIVSELINQNNAKYSTKNNQVSFKTLNLLEDKLPDSEVIFCRDCLVHLSFNDIYKALQNIKKSKIKYLLTTTFPNITSNENIVTGRWRKLNFQQAPFTFPDPLLLIEENNEKNLDRKSLGLWLMEDIDIRANQFSV